jgi:hypothetical protein
LSPHHYQVVRDEPHGKPVFLLQLGEQRQDLRLYGYIKGRRGLIGNQQPGSVDERHGEEDALPLTARELVRIIVVSRRGIGNRNLLERGDSARLFTAEA